MTQQSTTSMTSEDLENFFTNKRYETRTSSSRARARTSSSTTNSQPMSSQDLDNFFRRTSSASNNLGPQSIPSQHQDDAATNDQDPVELDTVFAVPANNDQAPCAAPSFGRYGNRKRKSKTSPSFFHKQIEIIYKNSGITGTTRFPNRMDTFNAEYQLWKDVRKTLTIDYPYVRFDQSIWGNYFASNTKIPNDGRLKKSGKVMMMLVHAAMGNMSPNAKGTKICQFLILSQIKLDGAQYLPSHAASFIVAKCKHNNFKYFYYETIMDRPTEPYTPMKFAINLKGLTNYNQLHILFGTQTNTLDCFHHAVDFMAAVAAGNVTLYDRYHDIYHLYGESVGEASLLDRQFIKCCDSVSTSEMDSDRNQITKY